MGEYFAGLDCGMYPIVALLPDQRGWAGLNGGPEKARFSAGNVWLMAAAGGPAEAARPRGAAGSSDTLRFHSSGGSGRALRCPAAMMLEANDDPRPGNTKASSTEPIALLEAASHGDSGLQGFSWTDVCLGVGKKGARIPGAAMGDRTPAEGTAYRERLRPNPWK